jgi:hypothetical protein
MNKDCRSKCRLTFHPIRLGQHFSSLPSVRSEKPSSGKQVEQIRIEGLLREA